MRHSDFTAAASANGAQNGTHDRSAEPLATVAEALDKLRYGAVHLTIHDGRVVQIDVTERQRFS